MHQTEKRKCPICQNNYAKQLHTLNNIALVRCSNCNMIFADLDTQTIEVASTYDETTFYKYLETESKYTLVYYDVILKNIQKQFGNKKIKILDFGCGNGLFLNRAKKMGIDAYGLDFSPYSKIAKDVFDLKIETKKLSKTTFSENEFDVIFSHATYEHIADLEETTQKLLVFLKKGGLFIISGVPNYNRISRVLANNFVMNTPPGHVNFFEKKSLSKFYKKMNIKTTKLISYGIDIWFFLYFLQNNKTQQEQKTIKCPKNYNTKKQELNQYYQQDFTFKDKLTTWLYKNIIIRGTGKGLEIWGRK